MITVKVSPKNNFQDDNGLSSISRQPTKTSQNLIHLLHCYIRRPLLALTIFGLGSIGGLKPKGTGQSVYFLYTIFVLGCLYGMNISSIISTDWHQGFTKNCAFLLQSFCWACQTSLSATAIAFHVRRGDFETLRGLWTEYSCDQEFLAKQRRWIKRRINTGFVYVCLISVILIASDTVDAFGVMTVVPLELEGTFGRMIQPCKSAISILRIIIWILPIYLFYVTAVLTAGCWRGFCSHISCKNEKNHDYIWLLRFVMRKHSELAKLTNQFNSAFGFYMLTMFSTNTIMTVIDVYVLTIDDPMDWYNTIRSILFVVSDIGLIVILASAVWINTAAGQVANRLYEQYTKWYYNDGNDTKTMEKEVSRIVQETMVILGHLRATTIGVDGCGVFIITKEFLVTIFSIVFTYYLILMQFVYQTPVGCMMVNGTAIINQNK